MPKEQYSRIQNLTVKECPRCGNSHTFSIKILFEEFIGSFLFSNLLTQPSEKKHDVVLTCPEKGQDFVVPVPISLSYNEILISVQPGD